MDRTRTAVGRYRPWLLAGAPLCMISAYMIFMARSGASPASLGAWLFLLYVSYSIMALGHAAWASTLAADYHERSRIYGWSQAGLVIAMIIVPALAAAAGAQKFAAPGAGVRAIGWFIIVLAPTTIGLACLRTREPPARVGANPPAPLKVYLRLLARPTVLRILISEMALNFAPAVTAALFFFFFREAKGFSTTEANLLLVTYFIGALAGSPLWTRLAGRVGKHRALMLAAFYYVVAQSASILIPKGSLPVGVALVFLGGLAYPAATLFSRAMMADAADEAELHHDAGCTGLLYAMLSSTAKISSATAIFATFSALGAVGFAPAAHAANSVKAIDSLAGLFVLLPAAAAALGGGAMIGYSLSEARHRSIRAALADRADRQAA